jgi:hypothetical protein
MVEVMGKVPPEERTPYVVVAFQECERMNGLTSEIKNWFLNESKVFHSRHIVSY